MIGDVIDVELRFVKTQEPIDEHTVRIVRKLQWRARRVSYEIEGQRGVEWDEWADVPLVGE